MAKEYIEREALIEEINSLSITLGGKELFGELAKFTVVQKIDEAPSADVVEVVHGEWFVSEYEYLNCSVCGDAMYTGCNSTKEAELLKHHWKRYCPNCGAKMDGERKE